MCKDKAETGLNEGVFTSSCETHALHPLPGQVKGVAASQAGGWGVEGATPAESPRLSAFLLGPLAFRLPSRDCCAHSLHTH